MTSLVLAALVFAVLHLGLAGTRLRDRAVAIFGEKAYRGAFSLATVVVLLWLIVAFGRAPYLTTWGMLAPWAPVMLVLMLPATLLAVIGLVTPSPTAVGQERLLAQPPRGILRVTRHPFLTGVALWALLHLVGNGDLASLVFFASFAVVAVFGTVSIDAKRRRLMGEAAWLPFLDHPIRRYRRRTHPVQPRRNRRLAHCRWPPCVWAGTRRTRRAFWRLSLVMVSRH
jgi:uncharacterized membrane protein